MKRHPRFLVLAACALLALCGSCAYTGDPKPLSSAYLRTFNAGFYYRRKDHFYRMFIHVQTLRLPPGGGPLYLTATFENPQPGAPPLVAKGDSTQASKIGVDLETSRVQGMRDHQVYAITVRAYADKARTKPLDTLQQTMVYHYVGDPEAILRGEPVPLPRGMHMAYPSGGGR